MLVYDFITENPWLLILILLLAFGVIVLAVILVRKYSPHFKSTELLKSDEEIAKEEVDRLIESMDDNNKSLDEIKKEDRETINQSLEDDDKANHLIVDENKIDESKSKDDQAVSINDLSLPNDKDKQK